MSSPSICDRWTQTDLFWDAGVTLRIGGACGASLLASFGGRRGKKPVTKKSRRTGEMIHPPVGGRRCRTKFGKRIAAPEIANWMSVPCPSPQKIRVRSRRNISNRVGAPLMGRGLSCEPVDDVRAQPPSNQELLDALAEHLADTKLV